MSNKIEAYGGVFTVNIKHANKLFPDIAAIDYFKSILESVFNETPYSIESLEIVDRKCMILVNDSFGSIETPEPQIREALNIYISEFEGDDLPQVSLTIKKLKSENAKFRHGLPDHLSAKNSLTPLFYTVSTFAKEGVVPFQSEMLIRYYKSCLKDDSLPVSIIAYSILPTCAHFVIATWDQTRVSVERFITSANYKLSNFYASIGNEAGYLFNKDIYLKKISFTGDIAENIAAVHAAPINAGLCASLTDYEYSSYNASPGEDIASIDTYLRVVGRSEGTTDYMQAHANLHKIPKLFVEKKKKRSFRRDYRQALANYNVLNYRVKKIPLDIMTNVMLDLNDLGSHSFDMMIHKIFKQVDQRRLILKKIVTSIVLKYRCTYDQCASKLKYDLNNEGDALIIDIIYDINKSTGYAYDYIMKLLGLAYPNPNFLIELFKRFKIKYNIDYGDTIKCLEIYDQSVLQILSFAFGGALSHI
jgi:hypothetical protein